MTTTRGCPCGCDGGPLPPPAKVPRQGNAPPHARLTLEKIAPLFGHCYACDRVPEYRYIGTAYHPNWFTRDHPYEGRPVVHLGPGGLHRAPVSIAYPVFHHALQYPDWVSNVDLHGGSPDSYDNLPTGLGWHPGEANFDPNIDEYITCVREIKYYKYSTLSDPYWIYLKSWDWFQHI